MLKFICRFTMVFLGTSSAFAGIDSGNAGGQSFEPLLRAQTESLINQGPGFVDEINGFILTGEEATDIVTISRRGLNQIEIKIAVSVLLGFYKETPQYFLVFEDVFSEKANLNDLIGKNLVQNQEFKDTYSTIAVHHLKLISNDMGELSVSLAGEVSFRSNHMMEKGLPAVHQFFEMNTLLEKPIH